MTEHKSVLLNEAVEMLNIRENGIYVDGTLGRGGHSKKILEKLKGGRLYCFDLDEEAIERSKEILKDHDNVTFIHDNYKNMDRYVEKADGILLDLGVSSPQFDQSERGFSYRFDGPLDMRMDISSELTAYDIINGYSPAELERVLRDYGEEKYYRLIVRKILEEREKRPIETTLELVEIIREALPQKILSKKGHPAKQTFQALRIETNHELDSLSCFLDKFNQILARKGRAVIISFHSLEDRMVKRRFRELSTVEDDKRIFKLPEEIEKAEYALINRRSITAGKEELEENPRSKSARLRGIERL
ncbi:MAG: 16S rRNA (cytosine(1402)-N(4))-methyltransferase RsmH [Erysipelotrichaceae bacterium]|nr:16S rRNA (cytosine(1402)-N(4))-methyltransferase RsmH [Erysipelotrichaceae bacterium]